MNLRIYAVVRNGIVEDVEQFDSNSPIAQRPGTTRVECGPWVVKGWTYNGSSFVSPEGESDSAKLTRLKQINDTISDFGLAITNWAGLSAAQQKAVLLRCTQVLKIMLEERLVDMSAKD